jgi:hypothetical protein
VKGIRVYPLATPTLIQHQHPTMRFIQATVLLVLVTIAQAMPMPRGDVIDGLGGDLLDGVTGGLEEGVTENLISDLW